MKELLSKMMSQLSDQDKLIFTQLAKKLNNANGDINKLSEEERDVVAKMESKYSSKLEKVQFDNSLNSFNLLETAFSSYARQILAKDLNARFPKEEDAVEFVYQNKWLPEAFKAQSSAEKIFEDYLNDICQANQWRDDVVGVESDKLMAVGMTWFMVIYQLHQK